MRLVSKLLGSFAPALVVPRPGRFGWGRFGRADRPPRAIKRIGAIGLALAVTVAIGAVSAASASALQAYEFKAAEYPVEWKGTNTNIHRFDLTTGASIDCEQATFNTSEEGAPNPTGPSERLEVHPTYSKCFLALPALISSATVRTTGCNYLFTALNPGLKEGEVQIRCHQRGQGIEIESLGVPGCVIKIPPQTLTGTEFKNESGKVRVNMEIAKISFTASSQCGIIAGITGTGGTGAYRGAALFEGFNSLKGADAVEVARVPAPTVTNVEPHSGPAAGGTSVTITGTNFKGATAVMFGSTPAGFTVISESSITATSPAGTGTVDVTVTTPGGTSATSPADQFTYGPTVAKVEPNHGSPSGGTTVTITGTGFTGATAVKFGSTNAASFTFNSPTSITAVSPKARGAETVDVTVTTLAGTSQTSPGDLFTYLKQ
jgi:hypothetical protein